MIRNPTDLVGVTIVRRTHFKGEPRLPDERLEVSLVDAHVLVQNGKARLDDPAQAPYLDAAVRRADHAAVASSVDYIPSVQRPM